MDNKPYEALKLDNQVCFSLYTASKEVVKLYQPVLKRFNLTYTQYITLLVLWEKDNVLVKEVGKRLHLESNTLTPLLKRLETRGLITKEKDGKDDRNTYIRLTTRGKAIKEEALTIPEETYCKISVEVEELVDLKEKLDSLINKLEKKEVKDEHI